MEKVDTIEKWVVGPQGVVISECSNEHEAKEVAGIINSMILAAYHEGQRNCTHIDHVGTLYI